MRASFCFDVCARPACKPLQAIGRWGSPSGFERARRGGRSRPSYLKAEPRQGRPRATVPLQAWCFPPKALSAHGSTRATSKGLMLRNTLNTPGPTGPGVNWVITFRSTHLGN
mgnify:CR=1 FL=1